MKMPTNTSAVAMRRWPREAFLSPPSAWPIIAASLHETDLRQHALDAGLLDFQEIGELISGQIEICPILGLQRLLPRFAFDHPADRHHQFLLGFIGNARSCDHATPIRQLDIDSLLFQ